MPLCLPWACKKPEWMVWGESCSRASGSCRNVLISWLLSGVSVSWPHMPSSICIASLMGCILSSWSISSGSGVGHSESVTKGWSYLRLLRTPLLVTLRPSSDPVHHHHHPTTPPSRLCSSLSSLGAAAHAEYIKLFGTQIFRAGRLVSPCPKQWAGCWTRVWLWQRAAWEGSKLPGLEKYVFIYIRIYKKQKLCTAAHGVTVKAHLVYN